MTPLLIDSHCHLDNLGLNGALEYVSQLDAKNLRMLLLASTCPNDWLLNSQVAEHLDRVRVYYGLHPLEVSERWEEDLEHLRTYLPHAIGVGEIGLDFHGTFDQEHIPQMKLQMKAFEYQVRLAQRYHLPIVIHCRDAFFAIKEILIHTQFDLSRVLFHCFVEDLEAAQWIIENGGCVSYSGVITFKRAGNTLETAPWVPLERMVIETDSPYLTPVPFRGQHNMPEYVRYVAEKLAEIKHISFADCAKTTAENALRFFNINH